MTDLSLSRRAALGLMAGAALGPSGAAPAQATPRGKALVFAHRGASALRPEHTLAAYAKAIADGADFVEPDLVMTRDGVLVARHENNMAETTDVARRPEFADRHARKTIDGRVHEGWFTEDFTLAELKTLRVVERLGAVRPESRAHDGRFEIPTFAEVIACVAAESARHGRSVGLVPELKHSTYFARIGLPLEERFVAELDAHEQTRRHPVEVQSFETANLRALRGRLGRPANIRLLQLLGDGTERPADVSAAGGGLTYGAMAAPAGLAAVALYADGVAPGSRAVIPLDAKGRLGRPTGLVARAHAAGLFVRCWTFRPENRFLPADLRNDAGPDARNPEGSVAEIRRHLAAGIDGFFTDDPALGRVAVDGA